jgi:hypothetical protein
VIALQGTPLAGNGKGRVFPGDAVANEHSRKVEANPPAAVFPGKRPGAFQFIGQIIGQAIGQIITRVAHKIP